QAANGFVIERDVVVRAGAFDRQTVVVDDLRDSGVRQLDDLRAGAAVEVDHQQDLGASGERLLGLGDLGGGIAFSVDDGVFDTGGVERGAQEAAVICFPTGRRCAVRQEDGDAAFILRLHARNAQNQRQEQNQYMSETELHTYPPNNVD